MTLGERLIKAAKCCFGAVNITDITFCDDCPYGEGDECHYTDLIYDLQTLSKMAGEGSVICPNCGALIDKGDK